MRRSKNSLSLRDRGAFPLLTSMRNLLPAPPLSRAAPKAFLKRGAVQDRRLPEHDVGACASHELQVVTTYRCEYTRMRNQKWPGGRTDRRGKSALGIGRIFILMRLNHHIKKSNRYGHAAKSLSFSQSTLVPVLSIRLSICGWRKFRSFGSHNRTFPEFHLKAAAALP